MNRMFEALLPPLLRLVTKDCKQPVPMQVGCRWHQASYDEHMPPAPLATQKFSGYC
jgi:hypothetical protein